MSNPSNDNYAFDRSLETFAKDLGADYPLVLTVDASVESTTPKDLWCYTPGDLTADGSWEIHTIRTPITVSAIFGRAYGPQILLKIEHPALKDGNTRYFYKNRDTMAPEIRTVLLALKSAMEEETVRLEALPAVMAIPHVTMAPWRVLG